MATSLDVDSATKLRKLQESNETVIRMGVIGYGYWGPNIVRNFHGQERSRVVAICDKSPKSLQRARQSYPEIRAMDECNDILTATDIDAIAIVTPVWTHYELAKIALENGKYAFIENGTRVDLYYYDSTRVNLGLFQHDVNVLWDLAPHDLSIMDYLIKDKPEAIVATGERHLNGVADIAFLTLYYPNNMIGHINVNWLSPVKVRTTLIGGEKKMLVWNDLEADEKLKIYDKGVDVKSQEGVYNLLVSYRSGDMWAPQVEQVEALKLELGYFVECLKKSETPFNDGCAGLKVVRMLEAASKSLAKRGELVYL